MDALFIFLIIAIAVTQVRADKKNSTLNSKL